MLCCLLSNGSHMIKHFQTGNKEVLGMRCYRMEFDIEEENFVSYGEEREGDCIYTEDGSASLLDADEVSPEEEAFMRGYLEE